MLVSHHIGEEQYVVIEVEFSTCKPCTLWYKRDSGNEYHFNHLEDEHAEADLPKYFTAGKWKKHHMWLTSDVPPKVVRLLETKHEGNEEANC